MRYILAIILPPFALLVCGKPFQFILNLAFWLLSIPFLFVFGFGVFIWLLCSLHAVVVCGTQRQDRHVNRIVAAIEARNQSPMVK